ncbi:DUF4236 domain-containing protein [Leptospira perdikensis]|uniref:DUF4236 domain-containing protein n=1 Tax=Leptospira perdikensis TaxID=2484948 RepID=A0A4R9J9P1_9LEPT|nr:DUF4236 domain-containing protein [Leptospira perdikensis]TGL35587.1 DUF4236 domain-containing protein [Leptospira perdikensis]
MGISYRKSMKAGPFRINFSKSGVGLSTGIKGLRVGVNAKGKAYVGGGVAGFQYRQNLGSSVKGGSIPIDDTSVEFPVEQATKQTTILEQFLFMSGIVGIVLLSIFLGWTGFAISIGLIFAALYILNARVTAISFLDKHISDPLDESKLNALKERIHKIKSFSKYPDEIFQHYLITHVKNSFNDRKLSNEEKLLLLEFKNNLSSEAFENAIMSGFAAILLEAVEDEDFSEDEKNFLNEFIELVQLQNGIKEMLDELINYFSQIENLRNAEAIENITPSVSVGDGNEIFYYETKATIQKSKNISEEGTILISDKNLHIYTGGHTKVKITEIMEMSCDRIALGSLFITVRNRKTPLQIKCDDTLIALEFLRKMKSWSER